LQQGLARKPTKPYFILKVANEPKGTAVLCSHLNKENQSEKNPQRQILGCLQFQFEPGTHAATMQNIRSNDCRLKYAHYAGVMLILIININEH